ncbi:MAG: fatty acyl-AMP ligase [Gammaproteobacteria bacterium]|nr:fatty acyl-AMP ligase [Gammaproteobacteria bacterium]
MPTRDRDLISLLETQVTRYSDSTLYTFLNKDISSVANLTYVNVYERAIVIAAALQQRGLQKSPVALLYPHGPDFIVAFLAAILAGAWPMPLTRPRGQEWSSVFHTVVISGADTVLTLSRTKKMIPETLLVASKVQVMCTDTSELPCDVQRWQRPDVQLHDIAFIQYTSGSTSRPRGVIVTHENVLHNSASIKHSFGCSAQEVCVSWLPFHHDMGLIGHIIQPLYAGMPNYFLSPADFLGDPQRWLSAISRYRGTISGAPNFAYALCAERNHSPDIENNLDLSSWRLAYCGSERIVSAVLKRFARVFRKASFNESAFFPCYGMAESTLFVCGQHELSSPQDGPYPAVGAVTDNDSIAIVDPATLDRLPEGETGEVWIKSSSVSPGYFRDPKATREIFHQNLNGITGYMRTSDIGFIRDNALYFVGRLKNLIKRRGRSFHAEDIEERVESALIERGIKRCAAFAIAGNEEDALVLLLEHDGSTCESLLTTVPEDARALVCDALGIVPEFVHIVPKRSLPLTTSGKLQRAICRDHFLQSRQTLINEREFAQADRELLHASK